MLLIDTPPQPNWFVRHDIPAGWAAVIAAIIGAVVVLYIYEKGARKDRNKISAEYLSGLADNLNALAGMMRIDNFMAATDVRTLNGRFDEGRELLKSKLKREQFADLADMVRGAGSRRCKVTVICPEDSVQPDNVVEWTGRAEFMAAHLKAVGRQMLL